MGKIIELKPRGSEEATTGITDDNLSAEDDGTLVWECSCGNQLFNVLKEGIFCPNCGTFQIF